jgi:SPP1 gp7 family putative phage head morphogenesis protein
MIQAVKKMTAVTYEEYWEYPDKRQSALLKDINFTFGFLKDEIQIISDRFTSLDGELNKAQLKRLRRDIEEYKEADYFGSRMLMLYMSDLHRRLHIRRDYAFGVLIAAAFIRYYTQIFEYSRKTNTLIFNEKYKMFTGRQYQRTLPRTIYTDPFPVGVSPKNMIDTEAEYRAKQTAKVIKAQKMSGKPFDSIDIPAVNAELKKAKNALLKQSDGGGYHGILDTVMTGIIGYAIIQAAEDTGAETYTFYAVSDDRTTPACRGLNTRTFKVSEMRLGYNVPPISFYLNSGAPIPHPCRSWITLNR